MEDSLFTIYGEQRSFNDTKKFIEEYGREIRLPHSRYTHAARMIGEKKKVVDFGSGWGCFSKLLAENGNEVIGLEQDEASLRIARVFNDHEKITYSDERLSQLPKKAYDVVCMLAVLEHVHNPGQCLMTINSVLKPGGKLVLAIPNVLHLGFLRQQLAGNQHEILAKASEKVLNNYSKAHDHIQSWEPVTFVRLLASVGFKFIEHQYIEGVILPWGKYSVGRAPWNRYWTVEPPRIKNLSYTMIFLFQQERHVEIDIYD